MLERTNGRTGERVVFGVTTILKIATPNPLMLSIVDFYLMKSQERLKRLKRLKEEACGRDYSS